MVWSSSTAHRPNNFDALPRFDFGVSVLASRHDLLIHSDGDSIQLERESAEELGDGASGGNGVRLAVELDFKCRCHCATFLVGIRGPESD